MNGENMSTEKKRETEERRNNAFQELSYSKASKMMKKAEKQLGFKLLERRIGGSGGGGSRLTEEGRDLLKKYRELTRRVQEDADKVFAEVFGTEL